MDLDRRYRLAPSAALRPERFGGLIYRYDNRRLYFLHSPELVALLGALDGSSPLGASVDAFVAAGGLPAGARERLLRALGRLEQLDVLAPVEAT
jgi:putative mycofactocin binding protein MftB